MKKRMVAAAVVLVASTAPSAVRAETEEPVAEAPPAPRERQLAFVFQAGLGSPVGLYGIGVELAPMPWWVITAGVGGSASGVQSSLMTRVRLPSAGVGFGVGVSRGPFTHSDNGDGPFSFRIFGAPATTQWRWDQAYWLNVEFLSIETASTNSLRARFFAGLAVLLNRAPTSCAQGRSNGGLFSGGDGPPCSNVPGPFLYIGAAIGPGIALW